MQKKRRDFLKKSGLALAGLSNVSFDFDEKVSNMNPNNIPETAVINPENPLSIIGQIGEWANNINANKIPKLSYRRNEFKDINAWRKIAKKAFTDRMAFNKIAGMPKVTVHESYVFEGLQIEKISWQLPYGRPTEAIILKPENAKGKLPAVLAFHDHGGNKFFGIDKITRTTEQPHSMLAQHQKEYYEGTAWANELAKKGYVVMVSDAFAFGSRRVMLQDVPQYNRENLTDNEPFKQENIDAYNAWSSSHEQAMARSLFSAGTTWPAVFLAEDQKALDILCARPDVNADKIGCCGLSGGGLRSVYLGALDPRIKCAVPVGFMTTWTDFLLYKSFTHTWMIYIPLLPNELDFPDIMSLRAPLPTLVLNDTNDGLFTLSEMQKADKIIAEVYKKANASDHYKCSFHPGPHKFDKTMQAEAFGWFDRWLK
jgi:dienelactone hydrolase